MIRPVMGASDAAAIARIYNHYITNTVVTFEEEPVTAKEIARRIDEIAGLGLPYLVAEEHGEVVGYSYASRFHSRSAYRHSTESTVYLAPQHFRRGLGSALYERLLAELTPRGIHVVVGGISLPNEASIALHEKFGFSKVAHFKQVGFKFRKWIDVGYWQRTF